jgi:outer membrane lipoprotein-sorting protein
MKPSRIALLMILPTLLLAGPVFADAREEVLASWDRMLEKGSYRMIMESESRGRTHRSELDVSLPGSFHMRSPESEMILLPQGTWMKVNGSWMQFPMNMSKAIEGYTAEAVEDGKSGLASVEKTGEGMVEGCMATTYRYTSSGKFMGIKNDSTAEMAVCQDTGLPRLLTSTSTGKRRQDTVRIVYDFDTVVSIRPPR